ncbi:putative COOH-NH2 ligase [Citrobacter phage CVT22]|uniref:COOH-NH2 ligase n=1 Tax=Citrobacter phage CVT22 TaxID=1622234 RepID=A0A0R6CA73_9CAUD|nr:COOH.NH2 ligase [Citrobacter phage CVT22]AJT60765.1 putative COOH-NH2 ligase [Citrobacter phage CVT22]
MSNLLIGLDPELWVAKDGKIVSAYGLIGGTKDEPIKVKQGAVQVDGLALEFNIDPAHNKAEFISNIDTVMGILASMVPGYELVIQPVAHFGMEYIDAQPEKAKELGCSPDYDAWKMDVNPRPDGKRPFRTAAGHIHFGFIEENDAPIEAQGYIEYCSNIIRELDFYLALPSLFYDNDAKRRELYGKAGAFRPKTYGFEYRTLSNMWLSTKALKEWAYDASIDAWNRIESGVSLVAKYGDIQNIVNMSDKKAAERIIKAENILMPQGV